MSVQVPKRNDGIMEYQIVDCWMYGLMGEKMKRWSAGEMDLFNERAMVGGDGITLRAP